MGAGLGLGYCFVWPFFIRDRRLLRCGARKEGERKREREIGGGERERKREIERMTRDVAKERNIELRG